jgi:hypothetical protein
MAIDTTALLGTVKFYIKYFSKVAFQAQIDAMDPPLPTPVVLTDADFQTLADALAPAIVLVAQHIRDNADVVGITAGSDTSVGGVD